MYEYGPALPYDYIIVLNFLLFTGGEYENAGRYQLLPPQILGSGYQYQVPMPVRFTGCS